MESKHFDDKPHTGINVLATSENSKGRSTRDDESVKSLVDSLKATTDTPKVEAACSLSLLLSSSLEAKGKA